MALQPSTQANGLESQLRGMILNNSSPPAKEQNRAQPPRKKLNQAQRRQLSNQLSIPTGNDTIRGPQTSRDFQHESRNRDVRYNGPPSAPMPGQDTGRKPLSNSSTYGSQPQHLPPGQFTRWSNTPRFGFGGGQSLPHIMSNPHNSQYHGQSRAQPNYHPHGLPQQHQYLRRVPNQHEKLFNPNVPTSNFQSTTLATQQQIEAQSSMLEGLLRESMPSSGVDQETAVSMENFRVQLEAVCRDAIATHEIQDLGNEQFDPSTVQLKCFGSMASGFASKQSDMDLALLSPESVPAPDSDDSKIPRLLEKILLDLDVGARLLSKTRVPIIKICQKPTPKLLEDLRANRSKWEVGKDEDEDDVVADDIHEDQLHREANILHVQNAGLKGVDETPVNNTVKPPQPSRTLSSDELLLSSFAQKPDESFGEYYASAKRLLHKLGGEDIHPQKTLSPEKIATLTRVCKAFIHGLSSQPLRDTLLAYPSMNFEHLSNTPNRYRSLSGVYTQIEGERLILAWKSRKINVDNDIQEQVYRQLDNWYKTCNRVDLEPFQLNRYLTKVVQQLRGIPILQLLTLEQATGEHPEAYHFRVNKLCLEHGSIRVSDCPELVKAYIRGISNEAVRARIDPKEGYTENMPHLVFSPSTSAVRLPSSSVLMRVATYHHMLALLDAYKIAEGDYGVEESRSIEEYRIYMDGIGNLNDTPLLNWCDIEPILGKLVGIPDPLINSKLRRARDRYHDALAFPTGDIGVQCDINFSAQLAIHNTLLLRCYSLTDPRVKPFILFIKHWAKVRAINTSYKGTLSSYGYVLMALHYLVNIAHPFVCPNLQITNKDPPQWLSPAEQAAQTTCLGKDVRFWRNEHEIADLAIRGMFSQNCEGIGGLLRGFFEYYAQPHMYTINMRGFDWGRDVISLRTQGGILTKSFKQWTGARTETVPLGDGKAAKVETNSSGIGNAADGKLSAVTSITATSATTSSANDPAKKQFPETKEIRHKYLLAIEDPFELDHNVARTVNHDGICLIRDEFRRAWRIIKAAGQGVEVESLLDVKLNDEWKPRDLKDVFEGWRKLSEPHRML